MSKILNYFNNPIKIISGAVILLWIIISLSFWCFSIEIYESDFEIHYIMTRFWSLSISTTLLLFSSISYKGTVSNIILGIVGMTIVSIVAIAFVLVLTFVSIMFGWSVSEELYVNNKNPKLKIVYRNLGHGALDSGEDYEEDKVTFKYKKLNKYFVFAKRINLDKIDERHWTKINPD